MDLTTYSDVKLEQLRGDVVAELERRQRLADTPAQVAALADRYRVDGGDPADLAAVINPPE